MADRVGVIAKGRIILVEEKVELMRKLGKKQLILQLQAPLSAVPEALTHHHLELAASGRELTYTYDTQAEGTGIANLLADFAAADIEVGDLSTRQSSLEDIFVDLVRTSA